MKYVEYCQRDKLKGKLREEWRQKSAARNLSCDRVINTQYTNTMIVDKNSLNQ